MTTLAEKERMKGNEKTQREPKKAKSDSSSAKVKSDYQKDKSRSSASEVSIFHPKK